MKYLLSVAILAASAINARAEDLFDRLYSPNLIRALEAETTKETKELTREQMTEYDRVLPGVDGTFLIVETNGGRRAKMLVRAARRRVGPDKTVPIVLVLRFFTFKDGEERAYEAKGENLSLFNGFRFSLDLGQVVPEDLEGDLKCIADGDKTTLVPVGKAKLYLVTKSLPDLAPKKGEKLVVGEKFDIKYFNGTYQLFDDGRRSGKLVLKVSEDGSVSGAYFTDRDGTKYDVAGKIGVPTHSIDFTIKLPRVEQSFRAFLFTGDGQALTGTSRLNEREAGFYAKRIEE